MANKLHTPYTTLEASNDAAELDKNMTAIGDEIRRMRYDHAVSQETWLNTFLSAATILYKYQDSKEIVRLARENRSFKKEMLYGADWLRQRFHIGDSQTRDTLAFFQRDPNVSKEEMGYRREMVTNLFTKEEKKQE